MSENSVIRKRKVWRSSIADENQKVLKDYYSYAVPWRANAAKMESARFGRQFSNAETKELLAFRQAPLPISVSTAICDTADAMMVSAKPTVYVAPIINPYDDKYSEESKKVSKIFQHLISKSWYDSLGNLQFDRAVADSTNVGHGLLYAVPRSEYGEFEVDVKHLSWRYFFGDPSSIDPLYRDMDNMVYAMPISNAAAYRFVKSFEPELTKKEFEDFTKGGTTTSNMFDEDETYLRPKNSSKTTMFIQRLSLEEEASYIIIPKDVKQQATDFKYRTASQITDEMLKAEKMGVIKLQKTSKIFLVEHTSIGNYGYKVVYPISKYNIVPLVYDHRDTPYPYSRMWYLYPLQRALNKFMMSSVLNSSLLNSTRIMAEQGSIQNKKEWMTNGSVPGAILEYTLPVPGYSKPPEVILPTPMSEGWLTMPRYLTYMMEYISGIFSTMQGNPNGAPNVFSTVASLQSAGGLKIKKRLAKADATLSVLGEVIGQFYKNYAPMNGFSTNMRANRGEEIVTYNKLKMEVNDKGEPSINVDADTDLRRGFRKIRFTSSGSNGYEASTEAAMLTTLATQLSLPQLVPAILERINISGLDDLAKGIKSEQDFKGKEEQLNKMINELSQKSKQQENQIMAMVQRLEAAKAKGRLDVELQQFKDKPLEYLKGSQNNQGDR